MRSIAELTNVRENASTRQGIIIFMKTFRGILQWTVYPSDICNGDSWAWIMDAFPWSLGANRSILPSLWAPCLVHHRTHTAAGHNTSLLASAHNNSRSRAWMSSELGWLRIEKGWVAKLTYAWILPADIAFPKSMSIGTYLFGWIKSRSRSTCSGFTT